MLANSDRLRAVAIVACTAIFSPQRFPEKAASLGIKASPVSRPTHAGTLHRSFESGGWTIGRPRKLLAAWAVRTGSIPASAGTPRRASESGAVLAASLRLHYVA